MVLHAKLILVGTCAHRGGRAACLLFEEQASPTAVHKFQILQEASVCCIIIKGLSGKVSLLRL